MQIRFTLRYLYMIIMCRYAVPIYIFSPPARPAVHRGYMRLPAYIYNIPTYRRSILSRSESPCARPASAEDIIPVRRTSRYSITFFFFSLSFPSRFSYTIIIINNNIIIIIIAIAIASGGIFHGYRENVHRKQ